jgi:hypothetical protein
MRHNAPRLKAVYFATDFNFITAFLFNAMHRGSLLYKIIVAMLIRYFTLHVANPLKRFQTIAPSRHGHAFIAWACTVYC